MDKTKKTIRTMAPIVYVRPVPVADLPADIQDEAEGLEFIWAVHDEDGEQIALVAERGMAFMLARQNNMAPHLVH